MDRGHPRRFDDRGSSWGGETYRPSERAPRSPPPPRSNNYRARSPPPARRGRTPPYETNYSIRGRADERVRSRSPRRRSRSPITARGKEDGDFRGGRQRTPPRDFHDHPRSPAPRRRSRSPHVRDRSPMRQRRPEPTSHSTYRQRSPPRPSRYTDNRDGYDRRDYPQVRDEPRRFPRENNYRPGERARSPRRSAHVSQDASPRSQPISRRSSPPIHPDRIRQRSPSFAEHPVERRSPPYYSRDVSPPVHRGRSPQPPHSPHEAIPYREKSQTPREGTAPPVYRDHSQPPRDRGSTHDLRASASYSKTLVSAYDSDHRGPPTGPSNSRYEAYSRDGPPTGPAYRGEPLPNPRPSPTTAPPVTPARHRNGAPTYPDSRYSDSHSRRGNYAGPPSSRRSPPPTVPTGPRGGPPSYDNPPNSARWSAPQTPRWERSAPPFRGSNNSTSTTYPRTQRFNNPQSHLASVPQIVEGGKKQPSLMDSEHEKKLAQIEEEKRKLESQIEEKQRAKRAGLREWDRLERESKRDALRSELAEGHLERLSGEAGGSSSNAY